jgi:tetratricopeptide (TPR) repeat protein
MKGQAAHGMGESPKDRFVVAGAITKTFRLAALNSRIFYVFLLCIAPCLLSSCSSTSSPGHAYDMRCWEENRLDGDAASARGDSGSATKAYLGACQAAERLGSTYKICYSLNKLARAYLLTGNVRQAENYFLNAARFSPAAAVTDELNKILLLEELSKSHEGLAEICLQAKRLKEARLHYEQKLSDLDALLKCSSTDFSRDEVETKINSTLCRLSSIAHAAGDDAQAEQLLKRALSNQNGFIWSIDAESALQQYCALLHSQRRDGEAAELLCSARATGDAPLRDLKLALISPTLSYLSSAEAACFWQTKSKQVH